MKHHPLLLLACLLSYSCYHSVVSFSFVVSHGGRCRHYGRSAKLKATQQNNDHDVDSVEETEIDRRRFLVVSIIGSASVLAASENASAATTSSEKSTLNADTSAINTKEIFNKAAKKALGGGKAGAAAAVVQVLSLMWLRTSMNYQYRYGGTLGESLKELYNEGGVPRLYQGLPFAIVQGPLTRFGDTAANVGILALLESIPETASLPLPLKTFAGSITAGLWRIILMPIDTSKTAMQVEGKDGLETLKQQVIENGPSPLYQGAVASAAATAAGRKSLAACFYHFHNDRFVSNTHKTLSLLDYPWFLTYNFMNDYLPVINKDDDLLLFLVRSAALGLTASSVSDCVSNSLRVIKTTKQTAALGGGTGKEITYREALALVIETDGIRGLFGRGLQTRLLTNAIQGAVFSVLWKYFQSL